MPSDEEFGRWKEIAIEILQYFEYRNIYPSDAFHALEIVIATTLMSAERNGIWSNKEVTEAIWSLPINVETWYNDFVKK